MPTPTYTLISETVLGSAQASVTFSSIPGTYKDLVIETVSIATSPNSGIWMQFNNDTGSNYSDTYLYGDGSAAASSRRTSQTSIKDVGLLFTSGLNVSSVNILSYANTNINKTVLIRYGAASVETGTAVGLWRSNSAITSIKLLSGFAGVDFASGATFRLWGIVG